LALVMILAVAGCPAVEGALARCWARAGCGALVGGIRIWLWHE